MSFFSPNQKQVRPCSLGVDIGRSQLKAVLLEEDARTIHLKQAWCLPTPSDSFDLGILVKKREVSELLKQIVKECVLPVKQASVSLPMAQALVRWVEMPPMDDNALIAAAPFEARKYLPYPAESAQIVMTPMRDDLHEESEIMRTLLTAIPNEVVASRAETLEMAGLGVESIEIETFPLLRTHHERPGSHAGFWRGRSLGYLLIGEESSSMVIVQSGVPMFVRSFGWGSGRFVQLIQEHESCDENVARTILERDDAIIDLEGVFAWGELSVRRFCESIALELGRLDREIARLISYYRSLFPERSYEGALGAITINGGLANLHGLPEYFSRSLQIPTHAGSLDLKRFGEIDDAAKLVRTQAASFSVATGLALGSLQRLAEKNNARMREYVWRRAA